MNNEKLNQELDSTTPTSSLSELSELRKTYFNGEIEANQELLDRLSSEFGEFSRTATEAMVVLQDIARRNSNLASEVIGIISEKGLRSKFNKKAACRFLLDLAKDSPSTLETDSATSPEIIQLARERVREAILDEDIGDAIISGIGLKAHEWLINFFRENMTIIAKRLLQENRYNIYIPLLIQMIRDQKLLHEAYDLIYRYLDHFGIKGDRFFQTWQDCHFEIFNQYEDPIEKVSAWSQFSNEVMSNIHNMHEIEHERPSSVPELNKRFGIECFGRYKVEDLISQYDQRDDVEGHYGVVIFPKADHNGAFSQDTELIHNFINQLQEKGILTRIIEPRDKLEIYHSLSKLNRRYSQNGQNKITYALIGGHGNRKSIQFGRQIKERNLLTTEDFLNTDFKEGPDVKERSDVVHKRIQDFFVNNPKIVLLSCSTGQDEGVAQRISGQYSATVVAPNQPTWPLDISVDNQPNGDFDIRIIYNSDDQKKYIRGLPM